MPRHLISDAHEWINEIPTVPIYYLAKPQPRERAWQNQRGKKTLKGINGVQNSGRAISPCGRQVAGGRGRDNLVRGSLRAPQQAPTVIPWRALAAHGAPGRRNAR